MPIQSKPHLRSGVLLIAFLAAAFGFLAFIANPTPEAPAPQAEPVDRRPLAEVLAHMSEDKVKDPMWGGSGVAGQAAKMRAAMATPDFNLGPLSIGMTFEQFLGATSGRNKIIAVDTGVMGVYATLPDRFNAYFRKAEPEATAFRISYFRRLKDRAEDEVHDHLKAIWGEPSESGCQPSIERTGRVCTLTWWPVNGVRLVAAVTATDDDLDGRTDIDLSVNAFDDRGS